MTTKSDVYGFGIVLLELLTGKRAWDKKRPAREQNLVDWAKPFLKDHHKLDRLMDPRLEGQYSTEGAKKVAALALQCTSHNPKSRPNMNHVVKILDPILEFKDVPSGPFVYVVPTEHKINTMISCDHKQEETKLSMGNENQGNEEVKKQKKKGYRHKHPIKNRALYSDTHLYTTLKNQKRIPMIQGR